MVLEYFLDCGLPRNCKGYTYTVELAGKFLHTDKGTLPGQMMQEVAEKHGVSAKVVSSSIRRFALSIRKYNLRLYEDLVGERFDSYWFVWSVAKEAFEHYRERHTLLG